MRARRHETKASASAVLLQRCSSLAVHGMMRSRFCAPLQIFAFAKDMLSIAKSVLLPTTNEGVQIRVGLAAGDLSSLAVGM